MRRDEYGDLLRAILEGLVLDIQVECDAVLAQVAQLQGTGDAVGDLVNVAELGGYIRGLQFSNQKLTQRVAAVSAQLQYEANQPT